VLAGFSTAIEDGQRLRVRDGGIGEVGAGEAGSISFLNLTGRAFTCGVGEGGAPFCAFPLYGGNLLCIEPVARIVARWSTGPVPAGTVVGSAVGPPAAYGPGVLVDYAGAGQRDLRYDINAGWSWGGGSWARQVEADRDLVPLLVLGAPDGASAGRRVRGDAGQVETPSRSLWRPRRHPASAPDSTSPNSSAPPTGTPSSNNSPKKPSPSTPPK
jgi:hypothetical protein